MKSATKRPACIVATGEGWRQRFLERWPVDPAKVVVIENGSEIVSLLKRHQLRSFLPEAETDQVIQIGYVGAFEPWHGIHVLLKAVAKTIAQGVHLKVTLIGAGSELNQIKQQICDLNLGSSVTLTGHLSPVQVSSHLARVDIAVSPYCGRVEYSGLKLLDYKAAGLATIASGADGQPAVLEHGRTGWIVPPCDEEALCQALIHLATDTKLRKGIGQAARIEAEACHSWRHTAKQLDELFKQVIAV